MADAALLKELEPLLRDPKQTADGGIMSFCPAHTDGQKHGNRSLKLHPKYGITCFAGCKFEDILNGLRNGKQSLNGNGHHDPTGGKFVATYEYRDEQGVLVAEKCRIEYQDGRKAFRWRLPGGKWEDGLKSLSLRDMPLYGAEVVAKAQPTELVWYVEGEKAQRSLALQGFLAVTHGGGAGTRDFGKSLEVLRGRKVVLWADNDAVGREYMNAVMARLRTITRETVIFSSPIQLPEKGDAHDYFAMGGAPEALKASLETNAAPSEATVEMLGDDAVTVTVPTLAGAVKFELAAIETGGRHFDAEMVIRLPDGSEPYQERINLLSSSQRTELRRELDGLYGKTFEWARTLNKAFSLARSFYGAVDRSVDVSDIQIEGIEQFALDPLLPLNAPTIFFGDGSASKSTQAAALAFAFATGQKFLGLRTPGLPVLIVDWEDTKEQFGILIRRLGGAPEILVGRGNLHYWGARGIPLSQQVDAIKAKVVKDAIGLVIYDSISGGCSGQPEDAMVAKDFMNAVHRIGCTALCIAHITKAGQEDKPFGSVMWHNFARRTWLVKRTDDEDTDILDVGLICKKVNHGRKPRSIPVRITFQDPDGPIGIERGQFDLSSELFKATAGVSSRIRQALLRQAMTRAELAQVLDEKEDTIRNTMNRRKGDYTQLPGGKWGLKANVQE